MATVAERRNSVTIRLDDLVTKWNEIHGVNGEYDDANPQLADQHIETHLSALEFGLYEVERLMIDISTDINGGGSPITRSKAT